MAKNRPHPSTISSTESKLESFIAFQLTELASSIVMSVIKTGQSLLRLEITGRLSFKALVWTTHETHRVFVSCFRQEYKLTSSNIGIENK